MIVFHQKRRFMISIALLACAQPAGAAQLGTRERPTTDEQALRQIESQWNDAIVQRDARALNLILSNEFELIWADGSIIRKDQLIEGTQTRKAEIDPFQTEDVSIRILNNVAIVTGRFTQTVRLGERSETNSFRYTDIYRRTGQRWQAIAAQATLIRPKPAQ